jgi:hypothetical protein
MRSMGCHFRLQSWVGAVGAQLAKLLDDEF